MSMNELLPIIAIPLVIVLVLIAIFSMWKKVPQDKAGVITGLKRRVITGGGGLLIPGVERIDYISLGNMPLRVDTRGSLSSQGVPISVSTTAVIKVRNSPDAILTAIEQFTGKNEQEIIKNIMSTATAVLEGKLREIIATMTVEDLYQKREAFSSQVQEVVGTELGNMGLEVKNFGRIVMAYSARPNVRGDLVKGGSQFCYSLGRTCIAIKVVCSVACLE